MSKREEAFWLIFAFGVFIVATVTAAAVLGNSSAHQRPQFLYTNQVFLDMLNMERMQTERTSRTIHNPELNKKILPISSERTYYEQLSKFEPSALDKVPPSTSVFVLVLNPSVMRCLKLYPGKANNDPYKIRIVGGRKRNEGRVEIQISGQWGIICPDNWTVLEARVACKQAGLGYASYAIKINAFGGDRMPKLAAGLECDGNEEKLSDCHHRVTGRETVCTAGPRSVAGVMCNFNLPDLVPNATLIQKSMYLQNMPLGNIQCAMEENCAAPEAFRLKATFRDWNVMNRRLLRFSAMTWNFGNAEFRPISRKETWEWHLCHMHYHSMKTFAEYDIVDNLGNRVANGHKASFCLEDNHCMEGVRKQFACAGFGEQGITIGCADIYAHDIDCQWIDITEVPIGNYIFKMKVNPEYLVGELDFDNNAVLCNIEYTGAKVNVTNCKLGRG